METMRPARLRTFSRCGVRFDPAKKADRITGWNIMRRLLADAGQVDKPGLYISRS